MATRTFQVCVRREGETELITEIEADYMNTTNGGLRLTREVPAMFFPEEVFAVAAGEWKWAKDCTAANWAQLDREARVAIAKATIDPDDPATLDATAGALIESGDMKGLQVTITSEVARHIIAKLEGQPVRAQYGRQHETYRPSGSTGKPGAVVCTAEYEGSGMVCCEVRGWGTSILRPANMVVLPRGLPRSHVIAACRVLDDIE